MESDSASRTASIAPNEDNSRASHLKRKRGQCDGHENHIDSRRTKPQRRGDDPQPRDNNVQFVDQISRSKPITFASTGHSNAPCEFHFSESEIKILKVIGHGYHSVVFRIAAGERTYALKVHKYDRKALLESGTPKPNIFFESEHDIYNRLFSPSESPLAPPPTPHYHGYIKFTKPPQVNGPGSIPRKLFKDINTYRPAVYTDFLMDEGDGEHNESIQQNPRTKYWKEYFLNASGGCILQGLVLDEISGRHVSDIDTSNTDIARSGREGLEALHQRGVLHGDVKNQGNCMFLSLEKRVIWMDFSKGELETNIGKPKFKSKASKEIRDWKLLFKAGIEDHVVQGICG